MPKTSFFNSFGYIIHLYYSSEKNLTDLPKIHLPTLLKPPKAQSFNLFLHVMVCNVADYVISLMCKRRLHPNSLRHVVVLHNGHAGQRREVIGIAFRRLWDINRGVYTSISRCTLPLVTLQWIWLYTSFCCDRKGWARLQ